VRRRLLCFAAGSGLFACSLLAPSDAELTGAGSGGLPPGVPGSVAFGGSNGEHAAGSPAPSGGGTAGAGGSDEVGVSPLLPAAGSGGSAPEDGSGPPSNAPDAGGSEPSPCADCDRVRIAAGPATVELGSVNGSLHMEICPQDQVLVGMDYTFAFGLPPDFGYLTSVTLVCGELAPDPSAGSLDVVPGESLPARGAGSGSSGNGGRCPPGQVVTAFEGARNVDVMNNTSELRELTLHCAAPVLGADATVAFGTARPTQAMSADLAVSSVAPSELLPPQFCPGGQAVRGAAVHSGDWVDGISFVCGAPVVALPDGAACGSALECQSGSCAGTCQPRPCAAPEGCICALLASTQYAFCGAAQTETVAAARCSAAGMHLAYAHDPVTHGWLRSTASEEGVESAFWLGADDLSAGVWQWGDGSVVDLASELWVPSAQRGGVGEDCLALTRDGLWDDVSCALTLPFVCEAPVP
jgi:hypothetical protein